MPSIKRRWLWGDKRLGYGLSYSRAKADKGCPWVVEVWNESYCWRRDEFPTKQEAIDYAYARKRSFYGSDSASTALRKLKVAKEYSPDKGKKATREYRRLRKKYPN